MNTNMKTENVEPLGATQRTNEVKFYISGVSDFKFDVTDYKVSDGQPAEKNVTSELSSDKTYWNLTINAGRHGTSEVAKWFEDHISNGSASGAAIGCDTFDKMPEKLNFAYMGDISFKIDNKKYIGKDIVIAQGHNARSRNNWWIGGRNMQNLIHITSDIGALGQVFKADTLHYSEMVFYPDGVSAFQVTHLEVLPNINTVEE